MDQTQAETSILKRWLTEWPGVSTPVVAAGVETVLDNNVESEPDPPAVWCYVTCDQQVVGQRQTLGKPARSTYLGTFYVQIFYPAAGAGDAPEGTKILKQLGDAAVKLMSEQQWDEGVGEDGVITREATIRGQGDDGRWWILALVIPYEYTLVVQ